MERLPDSSSNTKALRVLIVRVGAMGDVLHGMPAVAALREALPDAHIEWAVEPRWAPLLQVSQSSAPRSSEMPLVDRVHHVPAKAWSKKPLSMATARSIAALRRELRAERYDVAIDLQGTIRSAVIAKMSGARRIVGSARPRESMARMFYTETVTLTKKHVVEQAGELVSHAMGEVLRPYAVSLPVDVEAERWIDALLQADGEVVLLSPTAGWGAKQWPAKRFGELALALSKRGYRVLVNASPSGRDDTAEAVVEASAFTAEALACTLPQLIALVRRMRLVVAGDSGPLHLAAALQTPVVALFGPTDPERNGPWETRCRVLRHASSVTDHHRYTKVEAGLAQIPVEEAVAAAVQVLHAAGGSPA